MAPGEHVDFTPTTQKAWQRCASRLRESVGSVRIVQDHRLSRGSLARRADSFLRIYWHGKRGSFGCWVIDLGVRVEQVGTQPRCCYCCVFFLGHHLQYYVFSVAPRTVVVCGVLSLSTAVPPFPPLFFQARLELFVGRLQQHGLSCKTSVFVQAHLELSER